MVVPRSGIVATAEIEGSPAPEGIAMSRDGAVAFVALQGRNQAAAIDLASGTIRWVVDTGVWPDGIGFSQIRGF